MTTDIRIRYLRDIEPLECHGDMIDLRCGETTEVYPREYVEIPLGVAMELPEGYEAHVYPRSSTFKRHHVLLTNSVGIIDEDYKGDNDEWRFLAYNPTDEKVEIKKNDRIAQFRIFEHQPEVRLVTVNRLGNADRGGIGSTGV